MTRVRFAPSPTGYVHVGNARTALFNYLHARRRNGQMVLRIEDTDVERSKKEYEDNLILDMHWLGIEWDEGPDCGGEFQPYRQSERLDLYQHYGQELIANGHAYYCFCSSEELQKEKEAGGSGYTGKCRGLDPEEAKNRIAQGENPAIRLKIPANHPIVFFDLVRDKVEFDSNLLSDPVIIRSSGMPAYNFSVVIDDHLMKIDLVIRGEDHISNTARQIVLYQALGFPIPKFAHLSMVMGADNTKLSKRHGSTSIQQFREQGYLPQALFNYLALLGWSPGGNTEIWAKEKLLSTFNLEKVSKSAAIFDYQKLKWMNREHIRLMDHQELGKQMVPFLQRQGFHFPTNATTLDWIGQAAMVLSNYHYLLTEIAADFHLFTVSQCPQEILNLISASHSSQKVVNILATGICQLESPVPFTKVMDITKKIQTEHGIKGKELYHPIRLALTGRESGIELKDFIPLIEAGSILPFEPRVQNMASRLKSFI